MTYAQALEQLRKAVYGKDVREALVYLFTNTKDVDSKLDQNSTNAIQNKVVWEELQKLHTEVNNLNKKLDETKAVLG